MRRLRLLGAWLVVLTLTTAVTWQIVNAAEGQINTNLPPIAVEAPGADSTTTSSDQASDEVSTTLSNSSSGSGSQIAPTTTLITSEPSDTSTASRASSTTQAQESVWTLRTIDSIGGTVVVRYRPDEVELQAATPAAGFQAEIDKAGPPDVRVEFESEDVEVRIEARWADGGLDVKVSD